MHKKIEKNFEYQKVTSYLNILIFKCRFLYSNKIYVFF